VPALLCHCSGWSVATHPLPQAHLIHELAYARSDLDLEIERCGDELRIRPGQVAGDGRLAWGAVGAGAVSCKHRLRRRWPPPCRVLMAGPGLSQCRGRQRLNACCLSGGPTPYDLLAIGMRLRSSVCSLAMALISLKLPDALDAELAAQAQLRRLSKSELMRRALKAYLQSASSMGGSLCSRGGRVRPR
jgi:hypothetical protein